MQINSLLSFEKSATIYQSIKNTPEVLDTQQHSSDNQKSRIVLFPFFHRTNSRINIYGLMYYLSGVKTGVTVVPGSYGVPLGNKMLYSLLLKRKQLSCTAWVDSRNTRDYGREKTNRSYQKHEPQALQTFFSVVTI
jgi:hypothetical protein